MELTRRQKNIIRRMCNGEEFYSSESPRMTMREMDELSAVGYQIQAARPLHEPLRFSPLRRAEFRAKARADGIV